MYSATMTLKASGQDSFYFLLADENITHLKRKIYANAQSLLNQTLNVKIISVEISNGEKIDYVKPPLLTDEEKRNAVTEWYKP